MMEWGLYPVDGFLFFVSIHVASYLRLAKVPLVYCGEDGIAERSKQLVRKCKKLNSIYYPAPLWNRHLVLVPFMVTGWYTKCINPPYQRQREICTLPDGERIAIDWIKPTNNILTSIESGLESSVSPTPIVLLHHGAYCDSSDMPGQVYLS